MPVDNQIDTLLEAERDAEDEIRRCEDAARQILNQALEAARVVSERARRRMTRIHNLCADSVTAESERLWAAFEAEDDTRLDIHAHPEHLEQAIARLAELLTEPGGE